MSRETVKVTGAEEMTLSEAVRRVARVIGRKPLILPAPVWPHRLLAYGFEWTMRVPLVARAQVRILEEGIEEASSVPADLMPQQRFTDELIARGLPEKGPFTLHDLRCSCAASS